MKRLFEKFGMEVMEWASVPFQLMRHCKTRRADFLLSQDAFFSLCLAIIFPLQFGETMPELLDDYKVPTLFSDDLFSVLSDSERPPYRWLVLGPARSGASWHVDPSLTSAWNSLLSGRKR